MQFFIDKNVLKNRNSLIHKQQQKIDIIIKLNSKRDGLE